MAMVGVVSGSLYRRTHSLSRLAWFWVGGRLAPFYIHQMNRVNSRNGSTMNVSTINIVSVIVIIIIIKVVRKCGHNNFNSRVRVSQKYWAIVASSEKWT